MSFTTIALAVFLKGVLIAVLTKYGKWKTHEQRREERQVLLAYRKWRKDTGAHPAEPVGVALKRIAERNRDVRAVK